MTTIKKFLFTAILILLVVSTAGCVTITSKKSDGGIFKSVDDMENWDQKVFVSKDKNKEVNISNVNVEKMVFNPQDSQNIYIGTREDGMYLTLDGGENWKATLTNKGQINNMAVNPHDGKTVYAAIGNKIFKTIDGGNNWIQIYLETAAGQSVTALAVDSYEPSVVYAGISDGRVLKSGNGGQSWAVVRTPKRQNQISQILINPSDTKIIYVATLSDGLYKSVDAGQNWQDASAGLKKYSNAKYFRFGALIPNKSDALLIVTRYGLLKTEDGGTNWEAIKLLTSPGTMEIYSLAINPHDAADIYYGTASAIYKTEDGGENWIAKSLPSKRAAAYLLVDPENPKVIYLGVRKIK